MARHRTGLLPDRSDPMRLAALLVLALPLLAAAQEPVDWEDGDYGPVVSTHMDAAGGSHGDTKILTGDALENYVFRGRLISLNADRTANLVFDTELMRVAAAWTGGYVDWAGAFKNQGPAVEGDILFATPRAPGWSRGDDWADPRAPKEGPLPKDWAHYEGLYLHGDRVILSYTVGGTAVLEMPSVRVWKGQTVIERNFTIGPTNTPLGLSILEDTEDRPVATFAGGVVNRKAGVLTVRDVHLPEDRKWESDGARLRLRIPPLAKVTHFTIQHLWTRRDQLNGDVTDNLVPLDDIPSPDLRQWTKGGPLRWEAIVETELERGKDDAAYVVDDISLPDDNPWKSKMRLGALDFFEDGRAAVSTWDGDVWIASGLDRSDGTVSWKRFATGLHQPLGLKIIDGVIHTAGRDQITKLHDLNDDGEADWFENFNNDAGLTPQRHEYVLDLHTDDAGNLYYCRSGHYMPSERGENCCVMKLPPDGSKLEVVARGLREPNGMSLAPPDGPYAGLITVGDNEGDGIPQTPIYPVEPGDFFGFTGALRKGERTELGPWRKPIVWLPKTVDQSAGGQVWVTSDRWGPLEGHLLHTSYGHCKLFHVMLDRVDDTWQGAAVEFPLPFTSGIMRGRFRKQDGQLYVCGLRGWGTSAAKEGQLCRVRYTERPFRQPLAFHATADGIALEFDVPLDPETATDDQNWVVEVRGTGDERSEELFVDKLSLSKDGRWIELVLEESEPVEMMTIEYRLRAADRTELNDRVHATINVVPDE